VDLAKADFDDIYNQPDARAYYTTLAGLDYEIPQHGADVFAEVVQGCFGDRTPTLLDVCCSYGTFGVLLTTDLSLGDLYEHYGRVARPVRAASRCGRPTPTCSRPTGGPARRRWSGWTSRTAPSATGSRPERSTQRSPRTWRTPRRQLPWPRRCAPSI